MLALVAACARDVSVTETAAGAAPLNELENVHLGMRASDLKSARPNIAVAGYYGFQESLGTHNVMYEVPGSANDNQEPPASARVKSVSAWETLPPGAAANVRWQSEMQRVAATREPAPICYEVRFTDRTGWVAVWPYAGAELFVVGAPASTGPPGVAQAATIQIGLARPGEAGWRTPIHLRKECAALSATPA